MRFYAGILTFIAIVHSSHSHGYSTSVGGAGASAGAGAFSSAGGTVEQVGVGGIGQPPATFTNPNPVNNNYGGQYPYLDNNVNSYGGSAGGGAFAGAGAVPFLPPANPYAPQGYDYQNLFVNFWKSLNDNYANAATMTYSTPGANAYAAASSGPSELIQQQLAQQAALFNQINAAGSRFGGSTGVEGSSGGYYAPNYASSSASLGPQGTYQTANIIPANPDSPNVDTRIGADQPLVTVSAGQPGYYGVSSSSFAVSSDVNGQKSSHREASTSINDNGKVTTYTVKS
ncbi:hypothetical protein DMENIID0001_113300 [Sergentomyia squamirostris]